MISVKRFWPPIRNPRVLAVVASGVTVVALVLIVWLLGAMPSLRPGEDMAGGLPPSSTKWLAEVAPLVPSEALTPRELFDQARQERGTQRAGEIERALCRGKVEKPDHAFRRYRRAVVNEGEPICSGIERGLARAPLAVQMGAGLGGLLTVLLLMATALGWFAVMTVLFTDFRRWWLYDRPTLS